MRPRPSPSAVQGPKLSDPDDDGEDDAQAQRSTDLLLLDRAVHADAGIELRNGGNINLLLHRRSPLKHVDPRQRRKGPGHYGSAKNRRRLGCFRCDRAKNKPATLRKPARDETHAFPEFVSPEKFLNMSLGII